MTRHECIASIPRLTLTDCIVVCCCTIGIGTAHPRTRIFALLIDTSLVSGAFSIDHTFWLAFNIGIANVVSNTFARCCIVSLLAVSIDATRRGVARLDHLYWTGG